jgi:3-oxoacyl-[acyl-carrier-protein] synthase-3
VDYRTGPEDRWREECTDVLRYSFTLAVESSVKVSPACADNLWEYGHLGPNDALFNLETAMAPGELPEGGLAVVLNMSPVAAWSAMLVEHGMGDGGTLLL